MALVSVRPQYSGDNQLILGIVLAVITFWLFAQTTLNIAPAMRDDLQIAEIPELAGAVRPVHFRETLHPGGDPPMTFDYQMRPGVATTTNALRLMELVGLKPE